ncbi:hypothetical protein [Oceanirhabdus sp. W0125-5]|uniref:hypothetical protein n=1 Tax=Oceanirhabdus sp. W0125-5 TaxID=2999116 RepID=UPI0022F2D477|nr:hypothetical protein [Oceanirhabdus sp. W0125-5]WBW98964.1 hypothetical protein OW730_09520 [Oceanirhabdus sp. W0125-5]
MGKSEWSTPSIAKLSLSETKNNNLAACGTPPDDINVTRTCIAPGERCIYRSNKEPGAGGFCMHDTRHPES